jgi:hypothetical protein
MVIVAVLGASMRPEQSPTMIDFEEAEIMKPEGTKTFMHSASARTITA